MIGKYDALSMVVWIVWSPLLSGFQAASITTILAMFMLQIRFATDETLIKLLDYAFCIILREDAIG